MDLFTHLSNKILNPVSSYVPLSLSVDRLLSSVAEQSLDSLVIKWI